MLVGQQIGPFQVEKELGAGAMGAVYRGTYTKTGARVAIKVMLPGVGENEQAQRRFEREAAILKQFNHPNIVRLFGVGRHQKMRYYAMEYIEGEGIDRLLSRRGRLTWEEIVDLGLQLCSALQHAHDQGVVHRDLKPSNLMILKDGTLKLTDFGIAKDLDVTQLTSANCTVGTASYMSPEQCKGERNLSHKSDLYSLGIVFYELITGKKPFVTENVMEMFLAHVKGSFARPSQLVMEIPKGMDVLICQLMEKDPSRRPRDADAVAAALCHVKESVEAQQSAGIEAVRRRAIDRPTGEKPVTEEDREAARALLGKKKKKKVVRVPWYQQRWLQAAGLLLMLAGIGTVLYLALRPESAESLYGRIEKRMASTDPKERSDTFQGTSAPGREYLSRFGSRDDEQTRKVREWSKQVGLESAERELESIKSRLKTIKLESMDALTPAGKQAVLASLAEDEGDLREAERLWQELREQYPDDPGSWSDVATQRLTVQLVQVRRLQDAFARQFPEMLTARQQPNQGELEGKAILALRYEKFGDLFEAQRRWSALKTEAAGRSSDRAWVILAATRSRDLVGRLKDRDEKEMRRTAAEARLREAQTLRQTRLTEAEGICLDFEALYGNHPELGLADLVAEARKLAEEIRKERG